MTLAHLLEDFGDMVRGNAVQITDVTLEEERLHAFENGYQSGWDDAVAASSEDARKLSADFSQNLRELSFTYQEAEEAVMASLKPLLKRMADTVLPELAHKSLSLQLSEILYGLASGSGTGSFELATSPSNLPALESLVDDHPDLDLNLTEDASLAEGQVYIRLDGQEREFDPEGVLRDIRQSVENFFDQPKVSILEQPMKETA